MSHDHVMIAVVDADSSGGEYVPACQLSDDTWELLNSPLYAIGLASGDIIKVTNPESGSFEILKRGGNICIQFYMGATHANDLAVTRKVAEEIETQIHSIEGKVDGVTAGLISCTLTVEVGFQLIESIFEALVHESVGAQWQYANVYDFKTGEPLNWW